MQTVDPFSDQMILTRRGRVWANCESKDWTSLDASQYLIRPELRAHVEACVLMAGGYTLSNGERPTIDGIPQHPRELWAIVDPSGILYTLGPEHGEHFTDRTHGVPRLFLNYLRAYPDRILVHVTPTKGY